MAAARTASSSAKIPQLRWDAIRPSPIILVSGPQGFLADRATTLLRDFLRAEDPALEIHDIAADSTGAGELSTVASPSLFGEPRLVRVANVEKCSDGFLEDALRYLESPAEGACIVLRHGGGNRGKKLLDALRRSPETVIEVVCADLKKDSERHEFAAAEFARAGRRIRPQALRAVLSAFTGDLGELAGACQQLIADSAAEITEEVVRGYYGGRVETNAFAVADAAVAGRYADALLGLRQALDSGADPVPVVAALASKVRAMAKLSGQNGSGGELAKRFGLAPWQVDRARRDLRGWTEAGLARAIRALADTDAAIKGEGRDPVYALERLILILASRGTAR